MGGAAGHLNNLYDNPKLSFGKIKKVLSLANQGKLENVSEKFDGFNAMLSFRDGKAVLARNKTDLATGGMDIDKLSKREFAGGENVRDTYINVLKSFEQAIETISPKIQKSLFDNGKIFYNAEIIGGAASNVIQYNIETIKIHDSGHKRFDSEKNEIIPFQDEKVLSLLDKVVKGIETSQPKEGFQIKKKAFTNLKAMESDKDLKIAKIKLDKIVSSVGLTDKNTIEDYLRECFSQYVSNRLPEVNEEIKNNIVENLLGNERISAGYSKELRLNISEIKKQEKSLYKKFIYPIEETIYEYSVELLKNFESAFILDNKKESERLRQEVIKAIQAIQSSNNEEANTILTQQLQKLKNVENISTPAEGIVFSFEGDMYKFTGSFSPLNQILGLFRFGRGKSILPLGKLEELENINRNKIIALYPGGFKPVHAGHFKVAKYFSDMPEVDKVIVLISPKERVGHSLDNRITITAEMSLEIWKIYEKQFPKIKAEISSSPSPVKSVYDYFETLNPGDTAVLALGDKEIEKGDTRFQKAQEYANKVNPGIKIQIMSVPSQAGGISGGAMREIIASGDKERFLKNLPNHLSSEEKEEVWSIVTKEIKEDTSVMPIKEEKKNSNTFQYISSLVKEQLEKKKLEEVSVKDLKAKFPDYDGFIDEFSKNLENKYVYPALRYFVLDSSIPMGKITKTFRLYDKLLKSGAIKQAMIDRSVTLPKYMNDIDSLSKNKTFEWLEETLESLAEDYKSRSDIKKQAEQENEKIYEDENYLALWIKSYVASCYYGSGTDWCITKDDVRYWENYEKDNHIVFVFNKSLANDKQNSKRKTAVLFKKNGSSWECYDLYDKQFEKSCPNIPEHISEFLYKKFFGITMEEFEKNRLNKILKEEGGVLTENGWIFRGDLNLNRLNLKVLPKIYKIDDNFFCANNQLTSLEGCPESIGGSFWCQGNKLVSLQGCPKQVGGDFVCTNNSLTSLEGISPIIGGKVGYDEDKIKDAHLYVDENGERINNNQSLEEEINKETKEKPIKESSYQIISNLIKEAMEKKSLEEVSVKDFKAKYPDKADIIDSFAKNLENKYVVPAMRFYVIDSELPIERIIAKFRLYDKSLKNGKIKKAVANNYVSPKFNNIDWVSVHISFEEFADNVDVITSEYESSEDIKIQAEQGNEKIYEDENYLALWIKSHYASCYYGSGTDWCITKDDVRYWENYEKDNHIVFVFNKSLANDKQNSKRKTALLLKKDASDFECYDMNDRQGSCEQLPEELLSTISKIFFDIDIVIVKYLFDRAMRGDVSILEHPLVSKVKDRVGETPLHILARKKIGKETLRHPDVGKIQNDDGWTPLHALANTGEKEILNHPDANKLKNNRGETPIDVLKDYERWEKRTFGDKKLEETSSMSSGAVEGFITKPPFINFIDKDKRIQDNQSLGELSSPKKLKTSQPIGESFMRNRNKIIDELHLKKTVQNLIKEEKENYLCEIEEENLLRAYVRKIIQEALEDEEVPHDSTGINVLENLLKKVVPVIEEDYKSLTTEKSQRDSFRAHILNAIQNTILPSRITSQAGKDEETVGAIEEIDIEIGKSKEVDKLPDEGGDNIGPEGFIDISKKKQKQSNFLTIPGKDTTGRNMSYKTFEKIEKNITDAYDTLDNKDDQNVFYDFLLVNLKMYMDKWEDSLHSVVSEPESPTYDKIKSEEGNG